MVIERCAPKHSCINQAERVKGVVKLCPIERTADDDDKFSSRSQQWDTY